MDINGVEGGCLCGRIRYRVDGELVWSGYCHCESCRRFTGSVVTNWAGIREAAFVLLSGQPKVYATPGVERGFCADCGASLTYRADRFPDYLQLHLGSLDAPGAAAPMAHVHTAEQVGWFEVADDLPRFAGSAAAEGADWEAG